MYLSDQIEKDALDKMLKLAQKIIDTEMDDDIVLALKCREMLQLFSDTNQQDEETNLFSRLSVICEDLDGMPLEKNVRKLWDQDDLVKIDEDVNDIMRTHRKGLINVCVEFVEKYE